MNETEAARAAERARLADALHDDLLPRLAVLRQDVVEDLARPAVLAQIDAVIDTTRRLMSDEHPVTAGARPFTDAVHDVAGPICARAGLRLMIHLDAAGPPASNRPLLLSGIRDLVDNVAHHARATSVRIASTPAGEHWTVAVTDDGIGFDEAQQAERERAGHLGLPRLRARLRAVGGALRVDRHDGRTSVSMIVPDASSKLAP